MSAEYENIIKVLEEASSIVNKAKIDPALKPIAYQEVLKYLIQERFLSLAERETPSQRFMEGAKIPSSIQKFESFEDYRVYLRDKVRTNPEKLLAVVYWLKVKEKMDCVETRDIKNWLEKDPAWKVPKNLPRDLKSAQEKGWITRKRKEEKEECWEVTGVGKDKINEWLSNQNKQRDS